MSCCYSLAIMDSDLPTIALGPFWCNSGTRAWSLLLAPDRVIAWSYTLRESLQLALRFPFKVWHRDPGEAFRLLVRQGLSESGLPRTRPPRRYHVHLLRSIVIRLNSTANTVISRSCRARRTSTPSPSGRRPTTTVWSSVSSIPTDTAKRTSQPAPSAGCSGNSIPAGLDIYR